MSSDVGPWSDFAIISLGLAAITVPGGWLAGRFLVRGARHVSSSLGAIVTFAVVGSLLSLLTRGVFADPAQPWGAWIAPGALGMVAVALGQRSRRRAGLVDPAPEPEPATDPFAVPPRRVWVPITLFAGIVVALWYFCLPTALTAGPDQTMAAAGLVVSVPVALMAGALAWYRLTRTRSTRRTAAALNTVIGIALVISAVLVYFMRARCVKGWFWYSALLAWGSSSSYMRASSRSARRSQRPSQTLRPATTRSSLAPPRTGPTCRPDPGGRTG